MKRTIIEIIIIIIVASLIGILFNLFVENPLPFIKKTTQENAIPDTSIYSKTFVASPANLDKSLTYDQLLKALNDDRFVLIDARSPEAYNKGHIGNAVNIFPEYENEQEYVSSIFQIPEGKIIIVYCDGGTCDLSITLSKELIHFGFKRIFIYHGGWEEWTKNHK